MCRKRTGRRSQLKDWDEEGDIPVLGAWEAGMQAAAESSFLGLKLKLGDKLLPRLNMDEKPIANKYCEGKVKRTLKRGLKDLKPLRRKR